MRPSQSREMMPMPWARQIRDLFVPRAHQLVKHRGNHQRAVLEADVLPEVTVVEGHARLQRQLGALIAQAAERVHDLAVEILVVCIEVA